MSNTTVSKAPRSRASSNTVPRRPRPPYVYEPLKSPSHIRVLTIMHYDAKLYQVYARLNQIGLEDMRDRYTALSYTWGDPVEPFTHLRRPSKSIASPHTIDLLILPPSAFETFRRHDDIARESALLDVYTTPVSMISIGHNLSDWFKSYLSADFPVAQIRCTGNPFQATVFWIDAICINQADEDEKATQIPLMGKVYSLAGRVLGWLGADETDLASFQWWHEEVLPRISDLFRQNGRNAALLSLRGARFAEPSFWADEVGLELPRDKTWEECWAAYCAFYLSRKWFRRVWIVQEAVLAKRLELRCGGTELNWSAMTHFAQLLGMVNWLDGLNTIAIRRLPREFTRRWSRGFGITDLHGLQRDDGDQAWHILSHGWVQSWWAIVCAVRRRDCFLLQDKVYATVGFMEQLLAPTGGALPLTVLPRASTEDVFIGAAKVFLMNCPHLTVLSFVEPPQRRNVRHLPSWVPDLTVAQFGWPLGAFDSTFSAGIHPGGVFPPGSKRVVTYQNVLHLRGFRATVIKSVEDASSRYGPEFCEKTLELLVGLPEIYPHSSRGSQDSTAALVHTMTCMEVSNPHRGNMEETARMAEDFRVWLLSGLGRLWAARKQRISELLERVGCSALIPTAEELEMHAGTMFESGAAAEFEAPRPHSFKDQIHCVLEYRCLFSADGGWLGVCREDCQVGDEVWVLEGGRVPYVLRPVIGSNPGSYTFMGEAYLHGAMNGEMLETHSFLDAPYII